MVMDSVLNEKQGRALLQLARQVIAERLGLAVDETAQQGLFPEEQCGVFVTLKKGGILRGCIGNLTPAGTVADGVAKNAINAAFADPRFPSLTAEEFGDVEIDISVLSAPQHLEYCDAYDLLAKLRPGIDGVTLYLHGASATFLPQVWEQLPDPEQFLDHLCQKAGLAKTVWREEHPDIEIYQAQCFEEEKR